MFVQAVSEKTILRNRPTRNKNCLWWPCLVMDRNKMSNLYKEPSIDASYQVSVNLGKVFQRRRFKCEKLTDGQQTPSDDKVTKDHMNFGQMSWKSIKLSRKPSNEHSYQLWFQRKRHLWPLVSCVYFFRSTKKHKHSRRPSNEYSYQGWFQWTVYDPVVSEKIMGLLCSWSYDSWIYNYPISAYHHKHCEFDPNSAKNKIL
jgi:hypothetical protein